MKQVDIKDLNIEIDITKILNAVSLKKDLVIDIDGIVYIDEKRNTSKPIIFKLDLQKNINNLLDPNSLIKNILKDYKPTINGTYCNIKPIMAWQEIIFLNQENMLYFDHHTDGVELFENKELEEMGWHSIPFDISYRQITEFIEENCNGTLVFYDNQIQFNGFVFVDDIEDVKNKVKNFIVKKIKEQINENLIDLEDEDILESLEYFNIKV
ncbi:MAG: hypothetical protein GY932_07820 [Arcobacter sp.]|nr:hypothetical protein [Arcobacter sp.]